jgi:Flp pilus assembly protein TadB
VNPLQLGAAVAVLVAAGLWCLARGVRRVPRSLAAARRAMYGEHVSAGGRPWSGAVATGAPARWVDRRFGVGLAVAGLTPAAVATRVVTSAGILLFAVLVSVSALTAMGMLPVSPLWLVVPLVAAAMGAFTILHDVADKIERRRAELRRAANDFVQLVAVGLTTDQSVEEAVRFALGVGSSAAFDSLRDELLTAPQRGVALWEALDSFGRRHEVRELCEFATSLERQGLQGVSIGETVATLSSAMRAKALDELERDADRANANLSGPTIGFVVATIVFLAYPLAQRISDAFGG